MIWLVAGLIVFLGIHSVRMVAPDFRDGVIADRGEGFWKGLYSVVSLLGFVLLIWGFGVIFYLINFNLVVLQLKRRDGFLVLLSREIFNIDFAHTDDN